MHITVLALLSVFCLTCGRPTDQKEARNFYYQKGTHNVRLYSAYKPTTKNDEKEKLLKSIKKEDFNKKSNAFQKEESNTVDDHDLDDEGQNIKNRFDIHKENVNSLSVKANLAEQNQKLKVEQDQSNLPETGVKEDMRANQEDQTTFDMESEFIENEVPNEEHFNIDANGRFFGLNLSTLTVADSDQDINFNNEVARPNDKILSEDEPSDIDLRQDYLAFEEGNTESPNQDSTVKQDAENLESVKSETEASTVEVESETERSFLESLGDEQTQTVSPVQIEVASSSGSENEQMVGGFMRENEGSDGLHSDTSSSPDAEYEINAEDIAAKQLIDRHTELNPQEIVEPFQPQVELLSDVEEEAIVELQTEFPLEIETQANIVKKQDLLSAVSEGAVTEPNFKLEIEPEVKPQAETKVDLETEPAVEPESEPNAEPESEPEAEPESEPEAEPESEPEAEPESEPEAAPESEPEAAPENEPEAAPESEPEAAPVVEPEAEPESEPNTEPKVEPEPESEPDAEPKVEPGAEPEVKPEAESEVISQTDQKAEPVVEPEAEPEPQAEEESDSLALDEISITEMPSQMEDEMVAHSHTDEILQQRIVEEVPSEPVTDHEVIDHTETIILDDITNVNDLHQDEQSLDMTTITPEELLDEVSELEKSFTREESSVLRKRRWSSDIFVLDGQISARHNSQGEIDEAMEVII